MNSLSLKASALVLLGASQGAWGQGITECGPSSNDFDYEVIPQEGFSINWSVDTAAETISFQVISAAMGWTSVAFSPDGLMVGSDAVIGLPDDLSVLEYEMAGKSPDAVLPFAEQEITEASVAQDAAAGTTTVAFTRPLVPAGAKQPISSVPGDATTILFAYGPENPLGYHGDTPFRGSVVLDLFCGDAVAGGDAAGTPSPAAAVSSAAPSGASMPPTMGTTTSPADASAAPTVAEGATMTPTMTGMDMATPAPAAGDRADTSSTGAPTPAVAGDGDEEGGSLLVTASPSSSPADGDGQDTAGASRVGGGRWAAAAVAGVAAVVAALSL